jgi:hypothetical protein
MAKKRLGKICGICKKRPATHYCYPVPGRSAWAGVMACDECTKDIDRQLRDAGILSTQPTTPYIIPDEKPKVKKPKRFSLSRLIQTILRESNKPMSTADIKQSLLDKGHSITDEGLRWRLYYLGTQKGVIAKTIHGWILKK